MYLKWGAVGEGKKGTGSKGKGGGGSVYNQPGIRVDGDSRHVTKEGFPSKRGVQGIRVGVSKQRAYRKGWGMHLHISC